MKCVDTCRSIAHVRTVIDLPPTTQTDVITDSSDLEVLRQQMCTNILWIAYWPVIIILSPLVGFLFVMPKRKPTKGDKTADLRCTC